MGLQNSSQNRMYVKIKTDKETQVTQFFQQRKTASGYELINPSNELTGYLKKVEVGSYLWDGNEIETIKFTIDDDVDHSATIFLEAGFSNLTRGILNSLAGSDEISKILIRLYLSKENENHKRFPQAYVEINNKKSQWKYKPEQLPKVEKIIVKKKEVYDDSEVNEFFKKVIAEEINPKIKSEFSVQDAEMSRNGERGFAPTTNSTDNQSNSDMESDSLPF